MNSEKYIGLDVHQATISVAVMDSAGKLVMESILETKAAKMNLLIWNNAHPTPRARPQTSVFHGERAGCRGKYPRLQCREKNVP